MEEKILVAYATRHGSTKEIAERIVQILQNDGFQADLQLLKAVKTLNGYTAVVMGAPLYMFRWVKEAPVFLQRHKSALAKLPVAVFALGPLNDKEEDWKEVRREVDGELAKFPWFKPFSTKLMGGKCDPEKLVFPYNLIPAVKSIPAGDIRDWDDIQHWVKEIEEKLQQPVENLP